jgi:hypothetical protein
MLTQVFDKISNVLVVQFKISDAFGLERLAYSSELFIVSSDSHKPVPHALSERDFSVGRPGTS